MENLQKSGYLVNLKGINVPVNRLFEPKNDPQEGITTGPVKKLFSIWMLVNVI